MYFNAGFTLERSEKASDGKFIQLRHEVAGAMQTGLLWFLSFVLIVQNH